MFEHEPTDEALQAIEAEWSVIAAELELVDAECQMARHHDVITERARRRAARALLNALTERTHHVPDALPAPAPLLLSRYLTNSASPVLTDAA